MRIILLTLIQWDTPPNWVEVWGLFLSGIGTIAAVIAAWKILARDKHREQEVGALLQLARTLGEEALEKKKKSFDIS